MKINPKNLSKILFLILISLFSATAFAQGTTGTIEGTVSDQNGAPVAGASVSIENKNDTSGFKKSVTTDEKGFFIIVEIPSGTYEIVISAPGFKTYSDEVEIFVDKITISSPFLAAGTYHPGPAEEPTVDATPEIRTNNKKAFLDNLPGKTTFESLLKIVPNVRPELLSAGLQIDGASGSENTFFIDGQEVTNFRTGQLNSNLALPFELLQEVQVRSDGINAEYSGATGGVVNVVTSGGNNRWRGSFGVSFAPGSLQGRPNVVLNRFGASAGQIEFFQPNKDGGTDIFPTATISGPILKEKFWFFASYSPQIFRPTRTIDYFSTGANPTNRTISETIRYKTNVRTEAAFLRLDAQPASNVRISASVLYNPIVQEGALPANSEGLAGAPQAVPGLRGAEFLETRGGRQNSNLVNGQLAWNLTDNFFVNVRAGRSFLNEKLDSYGIPRITRFICGGTPQSVPGAGCSAGFQNISSNFARDYDVSKRATFEAEGALVGIGGFGRHNFRFGYQYNHLSNAIKEGYTDTGIVRLFYGTPISNLGVPNAPTPGNLGSGFLERFGTVGEGSNRNQAFYGQDSWRITDRLSLNLGVRFENENIPDFGQGFDLKFGWADKIAPRFGAAFDLFGKGKTKIFGSFGWYYDRLKYEMSRELFADIFFRDYFEILPSRGAAYTNYTRAAILGNNVDNPNGQCPIANSTGWSVCQFSFRILTNLQSFQPFLPPVDPGLKPQRTSEYTFGAEHNLGDDWFVTGRFIHRKLDRAVEDIGGFNDQGTEFYMVGNPGFGLPCEIIDRSGFPCAKAERKYDALEIILDKRANSYFMNFSYTLSRLFGNYSGLASSDEFGRVAPNVQRFFDLAPVGFDADGNPDNGRLATDRPHVFKAFGGYTFDWMGNLNNRTSVSAFTTFQSGTPLTTIYNLYSLGTTILNGRGDLGRTEMFSETDLFVSHKYVFGQDNKFSLEPYAVFLNLFDERNELSRQTLISATNFSSISLMQGGCTTCTDEIGVFETIFFGNGISQFVQNFLTARGVSATGFRNDYNLPNAFQAPRSVRFGLRFNF